MRINAKNIPLGTTFSGQIISLDDNSCSIFFKAFSYIFELKYPYYCWNHLNRDSLMVENYVPICGDIEKILEQKATDDLI